MRSRSALELARDLLGAVVVAFATIFLPKARPDDHWSARPGIETIVEAEADASGAGRRPRRLPATV